MMLPPQEGQPLDAQTATALVRAARTMLGCARSYLATGAEPERLAAAIAALEGVFTPPPRACVHPYGQRVWGRVEPIGTARIGVTYTCGACGEVTTMVLPRDTPRPT